MPRSGTTIISEAISTHEYIGWFSNYMNQLPHVPEVSFLNRIVDLPRIGRHLRGKKKQNKGIGSFVRSILPYSAEAYPVWTRCCGNRFLWDYMVDQSANEIEKRRTRTTVKKVLLAQGKQRFFAKLTGPARMNYLSTIFPHACFIHILRDPRAVVSSLLKVSFWKKHGGLENPWWENGLSPDFVDEWISSGRSPIALAAVQWKQVVELAWQESKTLNSGTYIEVRYEDFVTAPHRILQDIFRKVDLSYSEIVQGYVNSIGKVKNMNFKYHQNLTRSDILLVDRITLNTARKAGYGFDLTVDPF
jgi:hypothetical protein